MKTHQSGQHTCPPTLVRLNIHVKRSQAPRLAGLAERIASIKGRGVRLGEALEVALTYLARVPDADILRDLTPDHLCRDWLMLSPVHREPGALIPRVLRCAQANQIQN